MTSWDKEMICSTETILYKATGMREPCTWSAQQLDIRMLVGQSQFMQSCALFQYFLFICLFKTFNYSLHSILFCTGFKKA